MPQVQNVSNGVAPVLAIDRKEAKPLHKQIYDGYRAAIAVRSLRAGQQIPSTRDLSRELKISRIPVLTAYAQLLAEGYFETRVGTGTLVSRSLPDQPLSPEPRTGPIPTTRRTPATLAPHRKIPHSIENPP